MGLDQYLKKKLYVGGMYAENSDEYLEVKKGNKTTRIKIGDINCVEMEACYWRKNYAINEWFMEQIQPDGDDNCVDFLIEPQTIIDLRDTLKRICEKKTKKEKLEAVENEIPTHSWFTIDEFKEDFDYYIEDFEDTIKKLDKLIEAPDFKEADYYYRIWY